MLLYSLMDTTSQNQNKSIVSPANRLSFGNKVVLAGLAILATLVFIEFFLGQSSLRGLRQETADIKKRLTQLESQKLVEPLPAPLPLPAFVQETINGFVTAVAGERFLRVTAPNGRENFCIGKDSFIQWEHKGLSAVNVFIRNAGDRATRYAIGTFPSDFNETGEAGKGMVVWKGGEVKGQVKALEEAFTYEVVISGSPDDARFQPLEDASDAPFSLIRCEG